MWISIVASLLTIFIFVSGKSSLIEIFNKDIPQSGLNTPNNEQFDQITSIQPTVSQFEEDKLAMQSTKDSFEEKIIGEWELEGKSWEETFELLPNGKVAGDDYKDHEWELISNTHLSWWSPGGEIYINKIKIESKQLVLEDRKGEIYRYNRVD